MQMAIFYKQPFEPMTLLQGRQLPTGGEVESIRQNLFLMLATKMGELKFDDEYGFRVWDFEFDNNMLTPALKVQLIGELCQIITRHERRLLSPVIDLSFGQENFLDQRTGKARYRRSLEVRVAASLASTNEPFAFSHKVFIGPFSSN